MLERMLKFTGDDIDAISLENDFAFEAHRWIDGKKWIRNLYVQPQEYDTRIPVYYRVDEQRRALCPSILVKNFAPAQLPQLRTPYVVFGAPCGEDPLTKAYYSFYEVGVKDGAHRHKGYQEPPNVFIEFHTAGRTKEELLAEFSKISDEERYTFVNILEACNLAHIYIKFKRPISNRMMFSDKRGQMHLLLPFEESGGFLSPRNEYLSDGFYGNNLLVGIGNIDVEDMTKN